MGSGDATKFWRDKWVGDCPLMSNFGRLYRISLQKESYIVDMGSWVSDEWK